MLQTDTRQDRQVTEIQVERRTRYTCKCTETDKQLEKRTDIHKERKTTVRQTEKRGRQTETDKLTNRQIMFWTNHKEYLCLTNRTFSSVLTLF